MRPKPKPTPFHVYDSATQEEFPFHGIAAVSYLPSWQSLRMRCKFATLAQARVVVAMLDMYITRSPNEEERRWRAWRAANFLRAIPRASPSAIGIRIIDIDVGHYIPEHAERLRLLTVQLGKPTYWDWAVTRREAIQAWQHTPIEFRQVCKQIVQKRMQTNAPKLELRHYMAICNEVMDEYMPPAIMNLINEGDL